MDPGNDMHTIHHLESLRRKYSYYWPGIFFSKRDFRPALNLRTLISSLLWEDRTTRDEEDRLTDEEPPTNGCVLRKRKRSELAPGRSKRIRLDNGARDNSNDAQDETKRIDEDGVGRERGQIYTPFWRYPSDVISEACQKEDASFHQVYQFAVHLRYNKVVDHDSEHYADDETAANLGWLKEEEKLCSLLEARQRKTSLPQDIHVGRIFMTRYDGRLLALSGQLQQSPVPSPVKHSEDWLAMLPDIPWPDGLAEDNLEELNIQPSGMHLDFITGCAVLQSHHRAKLEASLQLRVLPEGTYDPTCDFPFELRSHFTLSLAIPETYNSFKNTLPQRSHGELEELQRRLLCFLSKTPLVRPVYNNMEEAVDVTIPFFLRTMCPAPPLPLDVNYESLQPDGLLATLMPFQRRTVAWMLEREDKRITPEGTVVSLDQSVASSSSESRYLPLFWEEIELGGRNFFFNRLTSALRPTRPGPHTALGGILAEEPGPAPSYTLCDWVTYMAFVFI